MKRKNTKPILITSALLALGLAAYPLYAGNKDNGKLKVQTTPQQSCSKAVTQQSSATPGYVGYSDWDPFSEFMQMRQDMLNLMNSSFNHYQDSPQWSDAWENTVVAPACDIRQSGNKYIVTMDLPGLRKSDIKIKLDGNTLSVSGKRDNKIEKKDGDKFLLQERTVGSFSRVIRLPGKIKKGKIEATYKDGTLKLVIPLEKPADNSVEIPIK